MTKQQRPRPINGWMASSQDTLVPYPLPNNSVSLPRKNRRQKAHTDPPTAMATTLTRRSMPNRTTSPRTMTNALSPRSMPTDLSPRTMATAKEQLHSLTHEQYQERRRPRHINFYRNGDRFFKGKKMLITPHRYTSFEDLLSDLTRNMKLPYGVRQIFTPNGAKIRDIEELKDGGSYVCASFERLKRMKYGPSNGLPNWNTGTSARKDQGDEGHLYSHIPVGFSYPSKGKYADLYGKNTFSTGHSGPGAFAYNRGNPSASFDGDAKPAGLPQVSPMKPKVVRIVKTGARPRKMVSLLINKRSVQSYEQLMQDVSDAFGLPRYKKHRIRKLFTIRGKEVKSLVDFYRDKDGVFLASTSKAAVTDDALVDIYEELFPDSKYAQLILKKKGKKKDDGKQDSGIDDGDDNSHKNKTEKRKVTKDDDSRVHDSRGENAGDKRKSDAEEIESRRKDIEDRMQEDMKKKELELKKKEEELRRKEEELKRREEEEKDKTGKEREDEVARKEAELQEQEEQLKRKEEEEAQLREASEAAEKKAAEEAAEREAKEQLEKRLKEEEDLKQAREEAEERLKEEQRAREEEALEEEEAREIARIAQEVAGSRTSLEGTDKDEESIQYQDDAEGDDSSQRFADLEADLQEESHWRAEEKDDDTLADSDIPNNDALSYKEDESEAPSPAEPAERFIRQPRTLVKKSDILVKYDIGDKIGDGNFADVHEATKKETSEVFAMKIIVKAKLKNKEHMVENEIAIMKNVQHKNIVRLYEEYETRGHIYLVMEYVTGGDLFDAITESTKFTEVDAALMVADLSSALAYLHNLNVVHRDLKPENLLVNRSDSGDITLKLADFGLAMEVNEPIFTVCGTPTYVAPEILAETGYGLEVDMWAVGVITYILLCGFPPFRSPDRDQEELFELIQAGHFTYLSPYWDNISSGAKDLINHLLVVKKPKRFTADQTLKHPWVASGGTSGNLINLQREVSMNLEKNFAGRRSAKRKTGTSQN